MALVLYDDIQADIINCGRCPRLRQYCAQVAEEKRAAFRTEVYWGRPIPNLGPASARLLILGLAPAAHGANRTGRMFTGDRSGDFLLAAMHATGFASQPSSRHCGDGLELIDCLITAAAHCAPPENKPLPEELRNCASHLDATVHAMPNLAGILALGGIAFASALRLYQRLGWMAPGTVRPKFAHGTLDRIPNAPFLMGCYHPSQQNTFTKRLTQPMMRAVFRQARRELGASKTGAAKAAAQ